MTSPAGIMPLDDVRVIDLTAGPFCTRILGDYGADVIKIERPGSGDPARSFPPFAGNRPGIERSGLFMFLNTNKRSVTIDLKSESGRDLVLDLVRDADVLVESFSPGTMDALGLGYERLRAVNPRLVMTSLSNYGQTGPYRDYLGMEINLFGMGGNMIGAGDLDHEPVKTAGRMVSYHAGYVAALATSMSLLATERDGFGEELDVSIFETATHSIDSRLGRLMGYEHTGHLASRPTRGSAVASGAHPCADGYFLITGGARFLPSIVRMIGMDELLERPEYATAGARAHPDRIDEFMAYLIPWTLERTKKEIRIEAEKFGVLGGPLNTIEDLINDESFVARDYFQEIDHPVTGPVKYPGYHFKLHRSDGEEAIPMPNRRRAPLLGEHTDEVLMNTLALSTAQVATLRAEGVI
ncbi:MAG: CoA transferase [Chloroflexi bacterium]|nr:CoA transferase [Chloroflexota bacterium]